MKLSRESKKLSIGLSLLVVCALLLSVTPVLGFGGYHFPDPTDFTASPTTGYAPLEVHFTDDTCWASGLVFSFICPLSDAVRTIGDDTSGATENGDYKLLVPCGDWTGTWEFGDGTTKSEPFGAEPPKFNVSHVYTQPGVYTVSLTWECADPLYKAFVPVVRFPTSIGQMRYKDPWTKTIELYIRVHPAPEKKTIVLPEPAKLTASYLHIDPAQVLPNQEVAISANVCNTGGEPGSMTVALMVSGEFEESQTVSVSPGACQQVSFTVSRLVPGTYEVWVDGMAGQFSVLAPRTITREVPSQADTGIGTAGIIAIIAVVLVLIAALVMVFRRT